MTIQNSCIVSGNFPITVSLDFGVSQYIKHDFFKSEKNTSEFNHEKVWQYKMANRDTFVRDIERGRYNFCEVVYNVAKTINWVNNTAVLIILLISTNPGMNKNISKLRA